MVFRDTEVTIYSVCKYKGRHLGKTHKPFYSINTAMTMLAFTMNRKNGRSAFYTVMPKIRYQIRTIVYGFL